MCQIDRSFANISFAKRCQPNYGLSQKTYICSIELRGGAGYECELRNIFIGVTATFISNGNVHSTRKGLILTPTTPLLTIIIFLGGRASYFISPPPPPPPRDPHSFFHWSRNCPTGWKFHHWFHEGKYLNVCLIFQGVQEWVAAWKDKLASCSDPSGDRYAVQNKMDRLSDLQNQQKDGDSRIQQVSELNAKTQLNTSSAGEIYNLLIFCRMSAWHRY